MSLNGISTLSTRQQRLESKVAIAEAKRQGKTVAQDGTISGSLDTSKPAYRALHTADISKLPTKYTGNTLVNNYAPTGTLADHRPWV